MVELDSSKHLVLRKVVPVGNSDGLTSIVVALLPYEFVLARHAVREFDEIEEAIAMEASVAHQERMTTALLLRRQKTPG